MAAATSTRALDELRSAVLETEAATPVRRTASFDEIECRDEGSKLSFVGHASVFDRLSGDLGGFKERVQRGAWRKVLDDPALDCRFLHNHDDNWVLARSTVKTGPGMLEMREDPKGLRVYAEFVPTTQAQDVRLMVNTGVVSQMSYRFQMGKDARDVWKEEDGEIVRTIISFGGLLDVCTATFPAYEQSEASMRTLICGVEIVDKRGDIAGERLRELAWRIHRGELDAAVEERDVIDAAFARTGTVSPWMAERAFRAASLEPELRAAIPGKRVTVVEEDAPSGEQDVKFRLAARQRRLRLIDHYAKEHQR